jgi:hypothetical protein
MQEQINNLIEENKKLMRDLQDLTDEVYRNNYSAHQDFTKNSNFTSRLKIPHYATAPTKADVGELIEVGGKLYICSSANTFSLVGTQS